MHDLASQAGIELPSILGKVEDCQTKAETVQNGQRIENPDGAKYVLCPHCQAKYRLKNVDGKEVVAGFSDIDDELDGQQIHCIKCGTKFTV